MVDLANVHSGDVFQLENGRLVKRGLTDEYVWLLAWQASATALLASARMNLRCVEDMPCEFEMADRVLSEFKKRFRKDDIDKTQT